MTEHQRFFLIQAQTDFAVFELLRSRPEMPPCHALHYLQMSTELLGKAHAWKNGRPPSALSHRAFVPFLLSLSTNRKTQKQLHLESRNANWSHLIRKSVPLAESIQALAPTLAGNGPNPEYPWPRDTLPHTAPAEYVFTLWQDLHGSADGRQFLKLARVLFDKAREFL